ncbi:MAG: hypothetical protein RLZ33_2753 [Bacteroidota bacterium]
MYMENLKLFFLSFICLICHTSQAQEIDDKKFIDSLKSIRIDTLFHILSDCDNCGKRASTANFKSSCDFSSVSYVIWFKKGQLFSKQFHPCYVSSIVSVEDKTWTSYYFENRTAIESIKMKDSVLFIDQEPYKINPNAEFFILFNHLFTYDYIEIFSSINDQEYSSGKISNQFSRVDSLENNPLFKLFQEFINSQLHPFIIEYLETLNEFNLHNEKNWR